MAKRRVERQIELQRERVERQFERQKREADRQYENLRDNERIGNLTAVGIWAALVASHRLRRWFRNFALFLLLGSVVVYSLFVINFLPYSRDYIQIPMIGFLFGLFLLVVWVAASMLAWLTKVIFKDVKQNYGYSTESEEEGEDEEEEDEEDYSPPRQEKPLETARGQQTVISSGESAGGFLRRWLWNLALLLIVGSVVAFVMGFTFFAGGILAIGLLLLTIRAATMVGRLTFR